MKKMVFAAMAVSTMLSTPAMAANWQGQTYGQDAWGIYQVNASVQSFCKFGASGNIGGVGTNGTAHVTNQHEADGLFAMEIQDPNDDTVRATEAQYNIDHAVCNSPFYMQLQSQNGGMKSARTTSDSAFIENVPYHINFSFDGNTVSESSQDVTGGFHNVAFVNEARAGTAHVRVSTTARDKLLLEGVYSDMLQARLSPVI